MFLFFFLLVFPKKLFNNENSDENFTQNVKFLWMRIFLFYFYKFSEVLNGKKGRKGWGKIVEYLENSSIFHLILQFLLLLLAIFWGIFHLCCNAYWKNDTQKYNQTICQRIFILQLLWASFHLSLSLSLFPIIIILKMVFE